MVRAAVAEVKDVYIPSGNRELFEGAAIFFAITEKCGLSSKRDLSKYFIKDTAGGDYIAYVGLERACVDPEYKSTFPKKNYGACGLMTRKSMKYNVSSMSTDTRLDSREGYWVNNQNTDYEYLYEVLSGTIKEDAVNGEKFKRLRERGYLTDENKVETMVFKGTMKEFCDLLPAPDEQLKERFAAFALEQAMLEAKHYPPQMQDLVVENKVGNFIGSAVAIMVMDLLYEEGIFKPLTEEEKISANLLVFSDILPE
ncbi:MAG: hypothetical protein IJ344_01945 [Clostridia bacterium]|nr:hypothetical protein [Clostridia bacterium]